MVRKARVFNFCLVIFLFIFLPSFVSLLEPITNQQLIHESAPWIVIQDLEDNLLAVETANSLVFDNFLLAFNENLFGQLSGTIVPYSNTWRFRFDPPTVIFRIVENFSSPYSLSISEISFNFSRYNLQNRWFYASVVSVNFKVYSLNTSPLLFTLFSFFGLITTASCQFVSIKKGSI